VDGPAAIRHAKDWSSRRKAREEEKDLSRLYVVETARTLAGGIADHRLAARPSGVAAVALAAAAAVGVPGVAQPDAAPLGPEADKFAAVAAQDLKRKAGKSIVIAGEFADPSLHALAHAINAALHNAGSTVTYSDPVESNPEDQL